MDGNPVAAKYVLGKLERLPTQDAQTVDGLNGLETVSALLRQPQFSSLSTSASQAVKISPPRILEYGV